VTIFPAKGLVGGVVALALVSGGLIFNGALIAVVLVGWCLLVILAVRDHAWLRANARGVAATITVPKSTIRGDRIEAVLAVSNDGDKRLALDIRPVLPEQGRPNRWEGSGLFEPGTRAEVTIPIALEKRGLYEFGDVYVRLAGPHRMLQAQRRLEASAACRAYPDINKVKEYLIARRTHSALAPHVRTTRLRGIGSEFESLRDYEDGDDVRRIDWKATAKHEKLITRNFEIEHFRNVVVVVDRGRLMAGRVGAGAKLDCAIDAALMVAGVALDSGDRAGLMVFDNDVIAYLPPKGGTAQLQVFLEVLHDVQPNLVESHFRRAFIYLQNRLTKRSLVIVLSDVIDVDSSRSMIAGMLSLRRRHLVILAALRTPEVEDVIYQSSADDNAPFRKAAAYRLLKERTEVMTRLQKGGVHVLDVRPEDFTVPLINKYIQIREQNLL